MKISKEQKTEKRKHILDVAITLMATEGIKETTFKRIAKTAEVSEPVIYRYFPSKDILLIEFFTETLRSVLISLEDQEEFLMAPFSQQLQRIIDEYLIQFEPQKPFFREVFEHLSLFSVSSSIGHLRDQKALYVHFLNDLFEAAIEAEEFDRPLGSSFLVELFWDLHIGILVYWIKDESNHHQNTLQLIDKMVMIIQEVLNSKILNRIGDLIYFLIREHGFKLFESSQELTLDQKKSKLSKLKGNKK